MKKAIYTCLLCALALFVSCSKSDSENDDFDFYGGYVSGTYWPLALNNSWKLIDNEGNEQIYFINNSIVFEGKTYYQLKPEGIEDSMNYPTAIGSENGVFSSYYRSFNSNGVSISAGKIVYIKTNTAVNEVWTDEMTLNISGAATGTIKFEHTGKIYEKNTTVTIRGKKYKDVIKTEILQKTTNSLTNISEQTTHNVWLAAGIGIIYESSTYDGETGTYELVNYSVK